MNLTEEPRIVNWPETHYVFVETGGPFMETAPAAWGSAHANLAALQEHNQVTGYMSLYRMNPDTYRAGFALAAPPKELPAALKYEKFPGGRYSRFVLTGPYSQLGPASGRVWQIVEEKKIPQRDDFAIENYLNDPRVTPPEQLLTEILVPTA